MSNSVGKYVLITSGLASLILCLGGCTPAKDEGRSTDRDTGAFTFARKDAETADSGTELQTKQTTVGDTTYATLRFVPGYYLCPTRPSPGLDGKKRVCVKWPETVEEGYEEQFVCRYEVDSSGHPVDVKCDKKSSDQPNWQPPCEFDELARSGGARTKWGRQCWDPPADYCRSGCVGIVQGGRMSWTCEADGSKCCPVGCQKCAECGDVMVWSETECEEASTGDEKSTRFCRDFFEKLPMLERKCIRGECSDSEETQLRERNECTDIPNRSLVFCRVD